MVLLRWLFDTFFKDLYGAGEKYVKITTLSFMLEILKGCQKAKLAFFRGILACMFFIGSFFSTLLYLFIGYHIKGETPFDLFFFILFFMTVISLFFFMWTMEEKRIMHCFDIQRKLEDLVGVQKPKEIVTESE
ncbi:MAG: hypothetical protein KBD63_07390, partial [Bacteriovoracaceae bacterium]|nr:hypothetical protein [Bacteriovoracaceae bacterium]